MVGVYFGEFCFFIDVFYYFVEFVGINWLGVELNFIVIFLFRIFFWILKESIVLRIEFGYVKF